ncbi:hypothetical protein PHMEG_0004442 [Phytophthora megakarya]|uniref:Uncharacterized protein n=1 Tax=Phytophthora megakarya TaxID=4795 RepID=A0A225WVF6_9STRA|nr:hypothetical protein PHMEG_0004442 [Phytophthora megakarya]
MATWQKLLLCMSGALPSPDVELNIDTSNHGLAALDPGSNSFIQVKFDDEGLALIAELTFQFSPEDLQETLHELLGTLQSRSLAASSAKQYSSTWSQGKAWCSWLKFSTSANTLINSRFSRLIAGDLAGDVPMQEILPPLCSLKSAILRGIISERLAASSASCQDPTGYHRHASSRSAK